MPRMVLEIDSELLRLLENAARAHNLSLEEECVRRLEGGQRRSRYVQAVIADLLADDQQRRVNERRS